MKLYVQVGARKFMDEAGYKAEVEKVGTQECPPALIKEYDRYDVKDEDTVTICGWLNGAGFRFYWTEKEVQWLIDYIKKSK